jgi:nucleotide-binding universal stress UspA family protein
MEVRLQCPGLRRVGGHHDAGNDQASFGDGVVPARRLIFTGVSGSPGSVQALRYAADLARQHDAILVPVLAWTPPGGDRAERTSPDPESRQLWTDDAWQRLRDALGTAFGGPPPSVCTWPLVVRGPAGKVLVSAANRTTDLLVIGAGRRGPPPRPGGRVSRYCLAQARCPVLAIPPAALAREAERGLRGWAFRHRGLDPAAYVRLSALGAQGRLCNCGRPLDPVRSAYVPTSAFPLLPLRFYR